MTHGARRRRVVRDLERWVRQLEQAPGCRCRRGSEVHFGELAAENGVAREGRRTDAAGGRPHLCFEVDVDVQFVRVVKP